MPPLAKHCPSWRCSKRGPWRCVLPEPVLPEPGWRAPARRRHPVASGAAAAGCCSHMLHSCCCEPCCCSSTAFDVQTDYSREAERSDARHVEGEGPEVNQHRWSTACGLSKLSKHKVY